MDKSVTSIGIDLSLQKSGIVVLEEGKIILKQLIKSKPSGDKPVEELQRLRKIVKDIEEIVIEYHPSVAVVENLAFAVRKTTALTQLAGLSFFVRAMLFDHNVPFFLCAPTSLKKFATGKGNSEKDHMILEVYKQYQVDFVDNNVADAIFLSKIGSALIGCDKMTAIYQTEVITLLRKQK